MRPGAVEISTLGAAGTAMLMNKVLPSSGGVSHKWPKTTALTVISVLVLAQVVPGAINLSPSEARRIGKRIWQNECGGTIAGLTSWNSGENFASLGIGHFIWYPKGQRGPFDESFPKFLRFAANNRAHLPLWLQPQGDGDSGTPDCPWNSRAEFYEASQSPRMKEMRDFLVESIDLQTGFMVERLQLALPKMVAEAQPTERENVRKRFDQVANSPNGCYALVDYVNFKGEGVLPTERYAGQGWGLLQVLEGMPTEGGDREAVKDFVVSAKKVLTNRVRNSPPARLESRWLPGWLERINTYLQH